MAGLDTAQAPEARAAKALSTASADLLRTPVEARTDHALKLTVLIAAGEATGEDALAFPWLYLRIIQTNLSTISFDP